MRSELTLPAADGFPLSALHLTPNRPDGADAEVSPAALRGAIVLAGAMGVRKRFYEPFAAYLAAGRFAVLTFDYRGIGDSLPGRLRGFDARLRDWGERDLEGALAWLAGRYPGLPLLVVGHSVGGQILGLAPSIGRVDALLAIAAQSGHWRFWPGAWRTVIALFWYVGLPAMVAAFGYLPMRLVTGGENVPAGVAREWARWGRHPDYVLSYARSRQADGGDGEVGNDVRATGAEGYERFDRPLRAYGFTDDLLAPPRAVERLLSFYPRARCELRLLAPGDLGVRKVGHFASFRDGFRDTLWAEWREWLTGAARAIQRP